MKKYKPLISVSTGMFYFLDFERTLKIISESGIKNIEIDGYWLDDDWEVAQHLRNYKFDEIIKLVKKYKLNISSFHDMSGSLYNLRDDIITKTTRDIIRNYDIPCIVTHFPYILETNINKIEKYKKLITKLYSDLTKNTKKIISIENMAPISNYKILINSIDEMLAFCKKTNSYINLDVAHVYESKLDLIDFLNLLKDKIRTIHISGFDIKEGRVSFKNDKCDIFKIFDYLDIQKLYSITIETKIDKYNQNDEFYIQICKELNMELEKKLEMII